MGNSVRHARSFSVDEAGRACGLLSQGYEVEGEVDLFGGMPGFGGPFVSRMLFALEGRG